MNIDDHYICRTSHGQTARSGWSEGGDGSLHYESQSQLPNGTSVQIHGWLKRHAEHITISWRVRAMRDDDAAIVSDPSAPTAAVTITESGLLRGPDENALRGEFERLSRAAATRCAARVDAAWGIPAAAPEAAAAAAICGQIVCPCGWANSTLRSKCRECGRMLEVQP